jgi:hypothetical protein
MRYDVNERDEGMNTQRMTTLLLFFVLNVHGVLGIVGDACIASSMLDVAAVSNAVVTRKGSTR